VFSATTANDKVMYVLLVGTILLGLGTTVLGNLTGHPHDYRQTVSPWFRSIFYLHPDQDLILAAPIGFRLHALAAFTLFAF
jgi:nitrate reductase gamma subunit